MDYELTEDLRHLLEGAILAPSSHNTQPWLFQPSAHGVRLLADRTRALPVNDPHDRELTISCGCTLLNLRAAAAAAGRDSRIHLLLDDEDPDLLAEVEIDECGGAADEQPELNELAELAELAHAIVHRRTYRKRFADREVDPETLQALIAAAERERATLTILEAGGLRTAVAHLVAHGDALQWDDARWRRELAQWMHPRRTGDGLTVPGLVAPIAQAVVRTFDMGDGIAAKDSQLAEQSPVLALLTTAADGPASWLSAGQALARVLLTACHRGLQASYLNQPIQVAALRPELQRISGLSEYPQILLRLGYPTEPLAPSPRRDLDQVIVA
ncbi:MAG: nitroreductase family protein [Pseudomonadales bacterium]